MNTKTIINIKTEKSLKRAAQETAGEIGIPLGTIVNAFLKQFVRDREVVVSTSLRPSRYLREVIADAERELEASRAGRAAGASALMRALSR